MYRRMALDSHMVKPSSSYTNKRASARDPGAASGSAPGTDRGRNVACACHVSRCPRGQLTMVGIQCIGFIFRNSGVLCAPSMRLQGTSSASMPFSAHRPARKTSTFKTVHLLCADAEEAAHQPASRTPCKTAGIHRAGAGGGENRGRGTRCPKWPCHGP